MMRRTNEEDSVGKLQKMVNILATAGLLIYGSYKVYQEFKNDREQESPAEQRKSSSQRNPRELSDIPLE